MGVLEVGESPPLAQQLAVDHHGEVHVQDAVVVDGQAQDEPHQVVLGVVFQGGRVEPEEFSLVIVGEHS